MELGLVSKEHMLHAAIEAPGALVLTDNLWSFMAWRIKRHTHGRYQHAMWLVNGQLYSQEWVLKRVPFSTFLAGEHRVKIIASPSWSKPRLRIAAREMEERYALPWWRRLYDPIGILGQRLRLPWINIPWLHFCSESVATVLNKVDQRFSAEHPSPEDLNRVAKALTDVRSIVFDPELSEGIY